MELIELLKAVKDHTLSKDQLEGFRDEMASLVADMHIEAAEIEKKKAFYWLDNKKESDIATERAWRVTPEGQRLIVLNRYIKACGKVLDSLKSRLYSVY